MTIVLLEKVSPSLRGMLTRWLLEPKTGVFVGTISARVRGLLWEMVKEKLGEESGAILLWSSSTEQGFSLEVAGETKRKMTNREGLWLATVPHSDPEKAMKEIKLGREAMEILRDRRRLAQASEAVLEESPPRDSSDTEQ